MDILVASEIKLPIYVLKKVENDYKCWLTTFCLETIAYFAD